MITNNAGHAGLKLEQRLTREAERLGQVQAERQQATASGGNADWYRPDLLWPLQHKD